MYLLSTTLGGLMKTIEQKRKTAIASLKKAKFEDSKAARLGSKTEEEWDTARLEHINYLESLKH